MSLDVEMYLKVDVGGYEPQHVVFFEANITHNLIKMASEAGIYSILWRPEEAASRVSTAGDIVERLGKGLDDMKARPEHYAKFDSENGWGLYKHFVPWLEEYLEACVEYPKAKISISR